MEIKKINYLIIWTKKKQLKIMMMKMIILRQMKISLLREKKRLKKLNQKYQELYL